MLTILRGQNSALAPKLRHKIGRQKSTKENHEEEAGPCAEKSLQSLLRVVLKLVDVTLEGGEERNHAAPFHKSRPHGNRGHTCE